MPDQIFHPDFFTAHWANNPTTVCRKHAVDLKALARHIQYHLVVTHLPAKGEYECERCKREESQAGQAPDEAP